MSRLFEGRGMPGAVLCAAAALAWATPASAARLSPVSNDFGLQQIGIPSAPKAFTLTAGCDLELLGSCPTPEMFSTGISLATTEFAQTNNCPAVLVGSIAGTSCTITVTFTPSTVGPRQDSLRTGVGGPVGSLIGEGVLPPKKRCKGKKGKKDAAAAKKKCKGKKKGKPRPVIEPT